MKTKFAIAMLPLMVVIGLTLMYAAYAQNTANYMEQGGASWVIGSGGKLTIGAAGTAIDTVVLGTVDLVNSATKSVTLTGFVATDHVYVTSSNPDPAAAVAFYVIRSAGRFQLKSTAATTTTLQYMVVEKN